MKRLTLRVAKWLVITVGVAWLINIGLRSVQFVLQELDPDWRDRRTAGGCNTGIGDLSSYLLGFRHGDPQTLKDAFPEDTDADGDGLSAWVEILCLKSDRNPDSDGDGVLDPDDRCQDCRSVSFRDRIESLLVSRIICAWASDKQRVYVTGTGSVDPSAGCPDTWFVVAPSWARSFFSLYNVPSPETEKPEFGVCELEPRLYVPGLLYAYEFYYYCGPLCAEASMAFVIDIPLLGPRYLGRKSLWVS